MAIKKSKKPHSYLKVYIFAAMIGFFFVLFAGLFLFIARQPQCANSISCIKNLSGVYDSRATSGVFEGKKVIPPNFIADVTNPYTVLGVSTGGKKRIFVDLSRQRLFAAEGSKIVYDFPISSGKWHPTPTGIFKIWIKLRYTRMTGGSGADFYDLPNVPFTQFFYNDEHSKSDGFSIHGAYWHNNFGHPMSHGCINMRIEDAEKMFYWTDPMPTGSTTYVSDDVSTPINIYCQTASDGSCVLPD